MKTLKLALVATLVAFAMVSVANANGSKDTPVPAKIVNLTLEQATHYPGLVAAMYAQIDKEDFLNNPSLIYVAEVNYNGILFRISGSRAEWIRFFKLQGVPPSSGKIKPAGVN